MKTKDELQTLVKEFLNDDNSISSTTSLPNAGDSLTIKDISGKTFYDRVTKEMAAANPELKEGEELRDEAHTHRFVAVTFEEGGQLSVATLLRSPDLTWDEALDTKVKRMDALQQMPAGSLVFFSKEVKTSKAGRSYNVYKMKKLHVVAPKTDE